MVSQILRDRIGTRRQEAAPLTFEMPDRRLVAAPGVVARGRFDVAIDGGHAETRAVLQQRGLELGRQNQQVSDQAERLAEQAGFRQSLDTEATFEERINDMIKGKRELAELAVGTGEQWMGNLSDHDLQSLFMLNRA